MPPCAACARQPRRHKSQGQRRQPRNGCRLRIRQAFDSLLTLPGQAVKGQQAGADEGAQHDHKQDKKEKYVT